MRERGTLKSRKIKGFSTIAVESQTLCSVLMSLHTSSKTAGGSTAFGLIQKFVLQISDYVMI